jgi:2-keto-4-pentenoate hydratase/2-oxohepta-3-ene-1,7-dioic acid hydratase in catechol pathway
MKNTSRRDLLAATAGAAAAAAITDASPASAQAGAKPIFPVPATTIPIVGETDVFQVRRIYCIGRNYAAHAIERGSDPNREPPCFFQKPTDAIQNVAIGEVADHPYPSLTKNYHHEIELVAALESGGTNIPPDKALDHVYGYALGLDMTRRDLQNGMAAEKKPWEIGKSFDHAAVLGPIHPIAKIWSSHQGRDLARRQRHGTAEFGPREDDLERRRADRKTLGSFRAEGRRHHLFRHAGKCRPGRKGRCAVVQARGSAGYVNQDRLERDRIGLNRHRFR